jgi:hypothetical protein
LEIKGMVFAITSSEWLMAFVGCVAVVALHRRAGLSNH